MTLPYARCLSNIQQYVNAFEERKSIHIVMIEREQKKTEKESVHTLHALNERRKSSISVCAGLILGTYRVFEMMPMCPISIVELNLE